MLSFKKLENLLSNKGFIINSIFIVDGYVTYLDVSSFKSVENFILYIPSNYDIKIDYGNIENVYKINNIEMNENGEIVKNCIDDLDDADIEKDYNEIDLDYNTETNLEEHLKDNYNRPVLLKNTKKDDMEFKSGGPLYDYLFFFFFGSYYKMPYRKNVDNIYMFFNGIFDFDKPKNSVELDTYKFLYKLFELSLK